MAVTSSPEVRQELGICLAELEMRPEFCESGADALAACARSAPELVVVDLDTALAQLPNGDPIELCSSLCSTLKAAQTPLLILVEAAADGTAERISAALTAGARDYLFKPFGFEEFARKLGTLVAMPNSPADAEDDRRERINWELRQGREVPFGNYTITHIIGRGGMATIYEARRQSDGERIAIKVLSAAYDRNPVLLSRFVEEAQVIKGISHPNIIKFCELGAVDGANFVAMELVDGGSLKDYLELEHTLDVETALDITACVASALAELHRHRIVHRDVKPGNILISSDDQGTVKLVDFGLAKSARDRKVTRTGIVLGTPRYIAPEQAKEGASADIRADIYSLGITLYQMLTGSAPFLGDDTHELLIKHLSENAAPVYSRVAGIPEAIGQLVKLMIAKSPDDRFQTPNQLLEGIELARQGVDPIQAIPADQGPALRTRPESSRNGARKPAKKPSTSKNGSAPSASTPPPKEPPRSQGDSSPTESEPRTKPARRPPVHRRPTRRRGGLRGTPGAE